MAEREQFSIGELTLGTAIADRPTIKVVRVTSRTSALVYAALPNEPLGSLAIATTGAAAMLFVRVDDAGAAADWGGVTTTTVS